MGLQSTLETPAEFIGYQAIYRPIYTLALLNLTNSESLGKINHFVLKKCSPSSVVEHGTKSTPELAEF